MQCSVRPYQGYPALWIDDTPIPSTAYITYQPEPQHYQEMYHAGVRLFSLGVYAGGRGISENSGIGPFRPGFYTGENSFDFSAVEQDFISASEFIWTVPYGGKNPTRKSFVETLPERLCGKALLLNAGGKIWRPLYAH